MNRTILFALCVALLATDVTSYRLLPWHGTLQSDTHAETSIKKTAHTPRRNVSDDYRNYSYIITTYL